MCVILVETTVAVCDDNKNHSTEIKTIYMIVVEIAILENFSFEQKLVDLNISGFSTRFQSTFEPQRTMTRRSLFLDSAPKMRE